MANIAIFRINYKSDFILTLNSDAGWMTPFCIKFWTGAPIQAYFVGFDGTTYTHCAPVEGEPTKLQVQFDDHHLPIGDLKFQIAYHFTVADFPTSVEDEVLNQASVIIEVDDAPAQVMLDLNGETAPEIEFSLPAYANEAQRIANEQERIEAEQQRITNEDARIQAEETRQYNEQQRIQHEEYRVSEFARLKSESEAATDAANTAATLANEKAQLAADKAALADASATLANEKAQLAADKSALAQAAATLANEKAALAQQKAEYAQTQGDYAKAQGDYANTQGDTAQADHVRAEADHTIAADDHTTAAADHETASSDHGRAEADHTTAAADHSRAEADHSTASADHTTATNDHTQAVTDHSTATSDHTQADNDHTRAESDHTRAESDHAAVEVYVDSLGAFDISSYHATGGEIAKYADLTAALGTNGANIPEGIRKGGMSVKFVQSSDHKYVRLNYLLEDATTNSKFTNVNNWQGVDENITRGSNNLAKSGSVYEENLQNGIAFFAGSAIPTFLESWSGNTRTLTVTLPDGNLRIYDAKGVVNINVSIPGTYTVTNFQMLVYDRVDNTAKVISFGGTNPDRYYILLGISVNAIYGLLAPHYYARKDKSEYFAYLPSGQVYKGEFDGTSYKVLAQATNFEVRIYDKGFSDYLTVQLNADYTISPTKALIIDLADSNTVKIIDFTQNSIFANKIVLLSNGRDGLNGLLAGHVYTHEINKIIPQMVSFGFIGSYKLKNLYEYRLSGGVTPSSTTVGNTITVSFYNSASFENVVHYCKAGTKLFVNISGGNTARPAIFVVNMQGVLKDKINSLSGQYTLTVAEDSIVYINLWSTASGRYIFSTQEEPDFLFNLFTGGVYSPYGIIVNGSTIGEVATAGDTYDNSSHSYRSVGTILYKGETVKFYKMGGAGNRPSFNIIDIKTSKLLFNTPTDFVQYYTAASDCYIVSNSSAYSQTPFISIAGVDEGEAKRRIAYLLSIRNPLYNGQNDGWDFDNYINNDTLVRLQTALASNNSPAAKTVSLVHFSDLHGSVEGLKSVLNFKKKYGGSINDILNTGDTVSSYYADGTWDALAAVDGIGTILSAVGNHDGSDTSGGEHDWEGVPKTDVYNRYFKPYVSNWGVVQPNNAETNGYCFYYKDYTTQKLRLIVLDDIISDNTAYYTAQADWLTGVLADAKTNGYSVVIAQHSRPSGDMEDINGFNSIYNPSGGFYPNDAARDAVDAFIEAGGDFVCWLLGHTHFDATRILTEHHNQIVIVISATVVANSNYVRRNFTESVLFNVVSFNTDSKMIRVARIGAHIDNCMQDNRSFCINWETKKGWKAN